MKNSVLYGTVITTVSVLLLSVVMFHAEARSLDKDSEITLKGPGIVMFARNMDSSILNVQVLPLENNKDVKVNYESREGPSGILSSGSCIGPKQILKVSGTNKASVEFNTADLVCSTSTGTHSTISAKVVVTDLPIVNTKFDEIRCNEISDGVDYCVRNRGSDTVFGGIGSISGFGLTMDDKFAHLSVVNYKHTEWTSP